MFGSSSLLRRRAFSRGLCLVLCLLRRRGDLQVAVFGPLFTEEEVFFRGLCLVPCLLRRRGVGGFSRGLCLVSCLLRRSGVLKGAVFGLLFTEGERGSQGDCVWSPVY